MNRDAFKSIRPFVLGVVLTLGSSTSVARETPEQNQVPNPASSNDLSVIAPEFTACYATARCERSVSLRS